MIMQTRAMKWRRNGGRSPANRLDSRRSFKTGTVMPGRSEQVQTISTEPHPEAPAASRPVSRSVDGLLALEGGTVHHGTIRGHLCPAEGDLIFTTAATG